MLNITVRYDAQDRTFKLIDEEFRTLLEGDALYDLAIPLGDADDILRMNDSMVAHA